MDRDASKVALVHLVARLNVGGYSLLDAQFMTDHLKRFGAVEITKAEYRRRLTAALTQAGEFDALGGYCTGAAALQATSQVS